MMIHCPNFSLLLTEELLTLHYVVNEWEGGILDTASESKNSFRKENLIEMVVKKKKEKAE